MKKTNLALLVEPHTGIAGNMILAALLDAGVDFKIFLKRISSLPIKEKYSIKLSETEKNGIRAKILEVKIHEHHHETHTHGRTFPEISAIIKKADLLSPKVKASAIGIFQRLAEAESKVHKKNIKQVHFHEVGAIDAIIDITGTCLALEMLGIKNVFTLPPPLGHGYVKTTHGLLPVPTPATVELMKGFPLTFLDIEKELTTPTGAAILTAIAEKWIEPQSGKILRTGLGAGHYNLKDIPNILRVSVLDTSLGDSSFEQEISVIETNLDDFPGENFSWLGKQILETGAIDYCIIPATMKKNRHGFLLQILCPVGKEKDISTLILMETSTLGVRIRKEKRQILHREIRKVKTPYGTVSAKFAYDENNFLLKCKAESDDCIKLAKFANRSYYEIQQKINFHLAEKYLYASDKKRTS